MGWIFIGSGGCSGCCCCDCVWGSLMDIGVDMVLRNILPPLLPLKLALHFLVLSFSVWFAAELLLLLWFRIFPKIRLNISVTEQKKKGKKEEMSLLPEQISAHLLLIVLIWNNWDKFDFTTIFDDSQATFLSPPLSPFPHPLPCLKCRQRTRTLRPSKNPKNLTKSSENSTIWATTRTRLSRRSSTWNTVILCIPMLTNKLA